MPRDPEVKLACKFSELLSQELTAEELDQVNERNAAEAHKPTCSSHDFCDANQVMADALDALGVDLDLQNPKQVALINDAWTLARSNDFDPARILADDDYLETHLDDGTITID